MADAQSINFILPAKDIDLVKATIRQEYPNALVGMKLLDDGACFVAVTLYSDHPVSLDDLLGGMGDRLDIANIRNPGPSTSDLVEKIKKARALESGGSEL